MRRYSFLDTIFAVNGVEATGWSEGDDVIKCTRRTDSASDKVGAAGEMMVSLSADRSGEVTIKLQQTSSFRAYLLDLLGRQEAGNLEFIPVYCTFRDVYRLDVVNGSVGYIKKPADFQRGAAGNDEEWTFVVERLDILAGDIQ